jgi:hypothetical protein
MAAMDLSCPRCGAAAIAPSAWSSSWRCATHGDIYPLRQVRSLSPEGLAGLLRNAAVPVMLPWPLPDGWLLTGFAAVGDERSGTRGCAVALSGPNPVGGPGEMLLISEEIGVGLASHGQAQEAATSAESVIAPDATRAGPQRRRRRPSRGANRGPGAGHAQDGQTGSTRPASRAEHRDIASD